MSSDGKTHAPMATSAATGWAWRGKPLTTSERPLAPARLPAAAPQPLDAALAARGIALYLGDNRVLLPGLPARSVDAALLDPPAGLQMLGTSWDSPWQYPLTSFGLSDGANRVAAPAISRPSRNPVCRKCRRHQRGWNHVPGCVCPEPDFDERDQHIAARNAFIAALTESFSACLRVLKPGAYALVWAIPKTQHWTMTALENAGFRIVDVVTHVQVQGYPINWNLGKI